MTANLAKTSTNANGNVTIGHYILGKSFAASHEWAVVNLVDFREGARQGNIRPREAGYPRLDRRKGNLTRIVNFYFI